MDNFGRAIYMACFALIFVFAASISIYLYGTLDDYLEKANEVTGIVNRAEGVANEDMLNFKREITVSEIYITLFNMDQMHVTSLNVGGHTITPEMVEEKNGSYHSVITFLNNNKDAKFAYSYSGTTVKYTKI